jgi:hypothetical protein
LAARLSSSTFSALSRKRIRKVWLGGLAFAGGGASSAGSFVTRFSFAP